MKPPHEKVQKANPHDAISAELAESMANTLLESWWRLVGRAIAAITRGRVTPFWLCVTSLAVFNLLLSLGVTLAARGSVSLENLAEDSMWAAYTILAVVVMRQQLAALMEGFRKDILPAIHEEHLPDLQRWARSLTSLPPQIGFALTITSALPPRRIRC
ncbi:MAG: hypothetical protein QMD04_11120 [Anaerolineales bacterium]|nr:hypothetical protein [Anaerolineales bacterium]